MKLCARGCCPEVNWDGKVISIKDDYGNTVYIDRVYLSKLIKVLNRYAESGRKFRKGIPKVR